MQKRRNVYYYIEKNYMHQPRQFNSAKLYQIGKMHCSPSHVVQRHAHLNWFELTMVTDGSGTVITNDVPKKVSSGDIYLSFPGEFHSIVSDSEKPLKYQFCAFFPEDEQISRQFEEIMDAHMSPKIRTFSDERIMFLVRNMISEITASDEYSENLFDSMLGQIQIYIIRNFKSSAEQKKSDRISSSEEFCYRIMNYIDTHIYTMESLSELSDATHYNYSYISALYKKTTGETLQDHYRRRRLEAARLLLSENKLSVTKVAELLHYSSIYTFSRSYKDYFGITPKSTSSYS